jgi:hypothetical protein
MARPLFALLISATLAAATQAADAKILITIDKSAQQMIVEVDGVPRWQWPVSTGRRGYATPSGTYIAFRMEPEHFSKEFDDAPMPHSIFFTRLGHAIHGSYETKWLGRAVSHGCVRLHPANAARLYSLVEQRGVTTATVVVTGGEPAGVARPAPRQPAPIEEPDDGAYPQPAPPPGYGGYREYRGFPGYGRPAPAYPPGYDGDPRGGYYQRW